MRGGRTLYSKYNKYTRGDGHLIYNVITNILGGGRKIYNIYIYLIYLILYIIIMIQGGGRKFYPGRHFVFEIISTTDRQTHTQGHI